MGSKASFPCNRLIVDRVDHVSKLSTDLKCLLNDSGSDMSDVVFLVQNQRFECHRVLLAARCSYFKAMLYGGMRESQPHVEIELPDATADAFRLLLEYVYTGCLELSSLREEKIHDLLSLAHKYEFPDLQKSISDCLIRSLTSDNVCYVYDVAAHYYLEDLKQNCLTYLDQHAVECMKTESFCELSDTSLVELLQRGSFFAAEIEIFHGASRWIKHNSATVEQSVMTRIVQCVRLPLIDLSDLLKEVRQSGFISSENLLDAVAEQQLFGGRQANCRGKMIAEVNLASAQYSARVVQGDMPEYLLNGEADNYDMEKGFTCHPIQDTVSDGIIVELGEQSFINAMRFLLWDRDARSYCYYIEVSLDKNNWTRVVDYLDYLCRSWQSHYIKPVIVRYIRIVGTHNTVNRVFHVVSFECCYTENLLPVDDKGIIIPTCNVASTECFATVIEGVSRSRNVLINGDTDAYDWESGYTCHQLGSGSLVVQLAQPYMLGSCRMLLWDLDDRNYSFYIEVSTDSHHWTRVVDKTKDICQSWQLMMFEPLPVTFIKIVGTRNSANEVFHCVHIQAPATL